MEGMQGGLMNALDDIASFNKNNSKYMHIKPLFQI